MEELAELNVCLVIGAKSLVAAALQQAGTRLAGCWHGSCCPQPSGAGACMPRACCAQPLSIQPSASVPCPPSSAGREEVCACDLHRLRRPALPPQRLLGALRGHWHSTAGCNGSLPVAERGGTSNNAPGDRRACCP